MPRMVMITAILDDIHLLQEKTAAKEMIPTTIKLRTVPVMLCCIIKISIAETMAGTKTGSR